MQQSLMENSKLITTSNPDSPIAEAYRSLRTNIQFSSIDVPVKTLMVTSCQSGDGKTTTIANLAVAFSQEGKRVLLVDADLRRPTLHTVFMLSNQTGLTNVLANQMDWEDAVHSTSVDNLFFIGSGPTPPNPSEMLGSKKMNQLIEELSAHYDMILFDAPPSLVVTDGLVLASKCDGVVAVISVGMTKRQQAKKLYASLEHVKAKLLGVVLNNKKKKSKEQLYYTYYGTNRRM
ncbi:CpsD/CapB family tyrosine-protein kinase [Paenibacillus sp. ATY16]|uniref:CpsD/CapB family tyrosine-protein kinase n=1 Tax=Paenibacillus sp. ATY16 TaxID=1759312 RepID=UPI0020108CF4|nr:CpsD/CapB family tyrosine-protein kinase [Paenibacillus sp. ATY16]MCK9862243.1 CpsD/CapB family tyrosine-protein kinase [Paenibacillus sp. ATY16]